MKNIFLLGILALLVSNPSFSQTDAVENKITTEDKLAEVTAICLDAIEAPTKYNEYVKPFLALPNFPQKTQNITTKELKKNIYTYFVEHTDLLDKIRKERKIAHDKLYGSRPY